LDVQEYEEEISFLTTTPKNDLPFVLKKRNKL
jgi:hypothetical protein